MLTTFEAFFTEMVTLNDNLGFPNELITIISHLRFSLGSGIALDMIIFE